MPFGAATVSDGLVKWRKIFKRAPGCLTKSSTNNAAANVCRTGIVESKLISEFESYPVGAYRMRRITN